MPRAYIRIVPAYDPERAAQQAEAEASLAHREIMRIRPRIVHLDMTGHSERWCHAAMSTDESTWREYGRAQADHRAAIKAAADARARPYRPPYAEIECAQAYDIRHELKARGYRFGDIYADGVPMAFLELVHPQKGWIKKIDLPGDPPATEAQARALIQPALDEVEALRALGVEIVELPGIDFGAAINRGRPDLAGLA